MNLKTLAVSILLFSVVILSSLLYLSGLEEKYNVHVDITGFNKTTERMETQQELAANISETVTGMELKSPISVVLIPYQMIKTAWNVMKMIFNSVWTIEAIFSDMGRVLSESGIPIPSFIIPTIMAVMIIVVIILIIESFIRWKLS